MALDERGISYQVASSSSEAAKPKHGKMPPLAVNVTLDKVVLSEFDAVLFLGGNVHEFTHKSPAGGERAKAIISECLNGGHVVGAMGNGWDVVKDSGYTQDCQMKDEGVLRTGKPKDGQPGVLLSTQESKYAGQLIDRTIAAIQSTN